MFGAWREGALPCRRMRGRLGETGAGARGHSLPLHWLAPGARAAARCRAWSLAKCWASDTAAMSGSSRICFGS
eukprot:2492503-Lingulodinium_polyedra.AAC.1